MVQLSTSRFAQVILCFVFNLKSKQLAAKCRLSVERHRHRRLKANAKPTIVGNRTAGENGSGGMHPPEAFPRSGTDLRCKRTANKITTRSNVFIKPMTSADDSETNADWWSISMSS